MTTRSRRALLAVILAAVAGLAGLLVWATRDDGDRTSTSTGSTTASTATSSSAASSTTGPTTTVPTDASSAVWPAASSPTRYPDPVAAARGFATELVGFTNPVLGPFMAGDARSGEVEVTPAGGGPVTTVFVRQLGSDGTWWVLGSATASIVIATPAAGATVSSPLHLSGTSTAFEANVQVQVHQDGSKDPIATSYVMGGSMGEMGPFTGDVAFTTPTATRGSLVLLTVSMADGTVREASVVRIAFR